MRGSRRGSCWRLPAAKRAAQLATRFSGQHSPIRWTEYSRNKRGARIIDLGNSYRDGPSTTSWRSLRTSDALSRRQAMPSTATRRHADAVSPLPTRHSDAPHFVVALHRAILDQQAKNSSLAFSSPSIVENFLKCSPARFPSNIALRQYCVPSASV